MPPKPKINNRISPLHNSILLDCSNYNGCDRVGGGRNTGTCFLTLSHRNIDIFWAFLAFWLSVELYTPH